jgi:hypothetical protein
VLSAPPVGLGKTGRLMWAASAEALEWVLNEQPELGLQSVLDERERQRAQAR